MSDDDAKKIDVSFDEAEKEFNETERTLEDIIDEELANSEREPEFKEEPKEEPVEIPVEVKDEKEAEVPEIEEEPKAFEPTVSRVAVETNDAAGIDERPVRASRKKSGKGVIVFLIILIILIAGGFLAYYLLSTQTIKNDFFAGNETKCETPKVDPVDKVVDNSKDEKDIIDILEKVKERSERAGLIMTYSSLTSPAYKLFGDDGETVSTIEKNFGLYSPRVENYEEESKHLNESAVNVLLELGFEKKFEWGMVTYSVYSSKDGQILCSVPNNNDPEWNMSCAYRNWQNEDDESLEKELVSAYKKKEENELLFLDASVEEIKESVDGVSKYQTIMANTYSSGMLFYRKDSNSDWVYVTPVQEAPSCSVFDDEAKEAFKGKAVCINEETGENVEL